MKDLRFSIRHSPQSVSTTPEAQSEIMGDIERITHHIGGAYWTAGADRVGDVYNPATGKVTGQVEFSAISQQNIKNLALFRVVGYSTNVSIYCST